LITSKHIKENGLDLESAYYISEKDYQEINNRSLVEKNDILYSMIGTIGLIYRVNDNPDYAIKNIGLFKIKDELKSKWLYYYLKTPFMKNYINSLLSGSTQQYITLSNLRTLTIKVPEKVEYSKK
jgi:type I restriction enzyme S subunit